MKKKLQTIILRNAIALTNTQDEREIVTPLRTLNEESPTLLKLLLTVREEIKSI